MAVEDELLRIFQKSENKGGPATENTLQDLVTAFERFSGQSGTANRNNTTATNSNTSATKNNTQGVRQSTRSFDDLNRNLKTFTRDLTGVISDFADVGNSLTSAARTLDNIPVIGAHLATILGAVARASEGLANSFINAAQSGATFAGTVTNFARAASSAGMTLDQFGSLIQSNSESLLGLGTTTEAGANRFARLSRQLIDTGDDLYALGFNTQGINEGFLRYTRLLRLQGIQQNRTDRELLDGTQDYMKTLDSLAKVTGKQRDQIAQEQEQIAANAQFQAAMAGASDATRRSFMELISVLPSEELKSLAMDVLATGTITQEQNRLIGSQFQGFFQNLTGLNQQLAADQALSTGQLNNIINGLRGEAGALQGTFGNILGANEELFVLQQAITSALRLQEDAVLSANAEQNKSIDQTEKFIETLSQAQQDIARLGNFFTVALAQSGLLPFLLDSFVTLGNFVHAFLLPVFKGIGTLIYSFLAPALSDLNNVVRTVGEVVGPVFQTVVGALGNLARIASNFVVPTLLGLGATFVAARGTALALLAFEKAKLAYETTMKFVRAGILASSISLTGAFTGLAASIGAALVALGPFALIGIAVGGLALLFMGLEDPIFEFKAAMGDLNDWFANFFGNISDDEYKRRIMARERERAERDAQRRQDNAFNGQIENYNNLYDVQQRDLQARKNLANYSNPVDEFIQFSKQQREIQQQVANQQGSSSASTSGSVGTSTITAPSSFNPFVNGSGPSAEERAAALASDIERIETQLEHFTGNVAQRQARIAELEAQVTPQALEAARATIQAESGNIFKSGEYRDAQRLLSNQRVLQNLRKKQANSRAEIAERRSQISGLEQQIANIQDPASDTSVASQGSATQDTTASATQTNGPPSPTITQTAATNTAGGLNNVSTLIELMKRNNELARRQISATEALSNDLFRAIG